MKQRAAAIVAEYLSDRPLGRGVGLSPSHTTTTCWRSRTSVMDGSMSFVHRATWSRGSSRSRAVNALRQRSASVARATRSTQTGTSRAKSSATASGARQISSGRTGALH
jgi:hypothetical protein